MSLALDILYRLLRKRLLVCGVGLILLLLSLTIAPSAISLILAAFSPGLITLANSRRRWSPVGFLAASIILSIPIWAIATLIIWHFALPVNPSTGVLFWCIVCAAICGFRRNIPLRISRFNHADAFALLITAIVAIPMLAVWSTNGPKTVNGEEVYDARLYIPTDTFYFFALAEEAASRKHYPTENPVFANVPNRYPSLIHCGVAGISSLQAGPIAVTSWPIMPLWMLPAIALGFLAVYRLSRMRTARGMLPIAIGYAAFIFIRLDHYSFPQTQAMAFGLLSLTLYYFPRFQRHQWSNWIKFMILGLILIASHTVSATVIIILTIASMGLYTIRKRPLRFLPAGLTFVLLITLFCCFNIYQHGDSIAQEFPDGYFKSYALTYVVPFAGPFLVCLFLAIRLKISPFTIASFGLIMLTVAYWSVGFSANSPQSANFSIFNASRFGIYALFVILPLAERPALNVQVLFGILLLYTLVLPNTTVKSVWSLIFRNPVRYSMKDVKMIHQLLWGDDTKSVMAFGESFGPVAFSGRPLYITGGSYAFYALGTVDQQVSRDRLINRYRFLHEFSPSDRLSFMRENGIGTIAIPEQSDAEAIRNFLPAGLFTATVGTDWTLIKLKDPTTSLTLERQ